MIGRIIAAMAFLAGAALTCSVLAFLKGFGASQAGMSAGHVPAPSAAQALIPWLAGSYFVVSAFAMLLCRGRRPLRVAALVAYSLLAITLLSLCTGIGEADSEKLFTGLLTLLLIAVLYFLPGHIIWAVFLLREGTPAQLGAPPNGGPAAQLGNSSVTEGPPSVS
jgi:hypothetical protein